jgi:hypothetical protein
MTPPMRCGSSSTDIGQDGRSRNIFKAIKTGCAFSERQLGDYEGLINALAVFAPIACRMLALRAHARDQPDAPATMVPEPDEIHVLRILGRRPLQDKPTARDALLAVAALEHRSR